jgi:hypothetical protein
MMPKKFFWLALIASLLITPICRAQLPGAAPAVPGAAGAAAPGATGLTGAPAPAAPSNIWSFLLPNADQKAACKTCFCNSPIGQLASSAGGPFSLMSGGLIKNRCLQNSIMNDIANNPADSPDGLAARVKKDEEDAKARRANVRFLGTVDCNYWPEAIEVLRLSLRKDRNECVRFEAALALRNGCCCNKEIIKALEICVTSSDADGFPKEHSDRVRAAATDALMRCPMMLEEPKRDDKLKMTDAGPVDPTDYYKKVSLMSHDKVVASARAALASMHGGSNGAAAGTDAANPAVAPIPAIHQRAGSLSGIVTNAFAPETAGGGTRQPFFSGLTKALTGKQETGVSGRPENIQSVPMPTPIVIPTPAPIPTPTPTPMPTQIIKLREPKTVTPIGTIPALPPEPTPMEIPSVPAVESAVIRPPEVRVVTPIEIVPPTPIREPMQIREYRPAAPRVGAESTAIKAREVRTPTQILFVQPAPPTPNGEPVLGRPREPKTASGTVEVVQPTSSADPAPGGPRESRGVVTLEVVPTLPALPAPNK